MTRKRTPLRAWYATRGISWEEVARRTGLGIATVMRAAAGKSVGPGAARVLEIETGIPARRFTSPDAPAVPGEALPHAPDPEPPAPDPEPSATPTRAPNYTQSIKGQILAEAEYGIDGEIAARYGIATSTLRTWRAAMLMEPECVRAYRRALSRLEDLFIADAARAFSALTRRLVDLAPTMTADEATHALERVGDVLIQARGLGRAIDAEDGDGFSPLDRQGAADSTNPESAGPSPVH